MVQNKNSFFLKIIWLPTKKIASDELIIARKESSFQKEEKEKLVAE